MFHVVPIRAILTAVLCCGPALPAISAEGEDGKREARGAEFASKIKPLLETYCYDCHGDGSAKGDVSLDDAKKGAHHLENQELWLRIWMNLRTDLMPPAKKEQPKREEREEIVRWIERNVFNLDPAKPDPGRVTMRRLNRVEYGNTIKDLLGIEFNVTEAFPPDDTGYGFDTIGDVLSISPLMMEKYLAAAEGIMAKAIPADLGRPEPIAIAPGEFKDPKNRARTARFMRAGIPHRVGRSYEAKSAGAHRFAVTYQIAGKSSAKDYTAEWRILVDDQERARRKINYSQSGNLAVSLEVNLEKGPHRIEFEMLPAEGAANSSVALAVKVVKIALTGPGGVLPLEDYPESYRRIFVDGLPPVAAAARDRYARKILRRFASRAFRRPVEDETVEKLMALARTKWAGEGGRFESGIRFAMTAVLSSPPFLLRGERSGEDEAKEGVVPIDEYSLASRLSYFLWSSTPDEALLELAGAGELRANLRATVDRMLKDPKAGRLARNFVGQWLQTRGLDGRIFDTARILGINDGNKARQVFNLYTREDMMRETELFFAHLVAENRPAVEMITADYSFLNDRLATFYGVRGVEGKEFRKVSLEGNPRLGGILSHGSFLIATSNPDRTSPVKRGFYVLDNLLGVPPPPPPPNVPALEDAQKKLGKEASVRDMMKLHRSNALCKSCHARMDPIGVALENFNALGQWRERDGGMPIETAGVLVTGESFEGIAGLRQVLAGPRKKDLQRCLTEKMLTFAVGRGVEYYDAPTVDRIIERAEKAGGGMREFIYGVVESAPFQLRRGDGE